MYRVTIRRCTLCYVRVWMNIINSLLRDLSGPRPSCRVVDRANLGCWYPSMTDIYIPSLTDSHPMLPLINWTTTVSSPQRCYLSCLLVLCIRTGLLNPNDGIELRSSSSDASFCRPPTSNTSLMFIPLPHLGSSSLIQIPSHASSCFRITRIPLLYPPHPPTLIVSYSCDMLSSLLYYVCFGYVYLVGYLCTRSDVYCNQLSAEACLHTDCKTI